MSVSRGALQTSPECAEALQNGDRAERETVLLTATYTFLPQGGHLPHCTPLLSGRVHDVITYGASQQTPP